MLVELTGKFEVFRCANAFVSECCMSKSFITHQLGAQVYTPVLGGILHQRSYYVVAFSWTSRPWQKMSVHCSARWCNAVGILVSCAKFAVTHIWLTFGSVSSILCPATHNAGYIYFYKITSVSPDGAEWVIIRDAFHAYHSVWRTVFTSNPTR